MIQQGAKLIVNIQQILEEYPEEINNIEISKAHVKQVPKEYIDLYNKITNKGNTPDELSKLLKTNIEDVNFQLTMLEIEGFIQLIPGNKYIKVSEI